jgi:hypothetical protein
MDKQFTHRRTTMRTFRKTLLALSLATVVGAGVIWGARTGTAQQPRSADAQNIQKPGHLALAHLALADVVYIQKPGH